MQSTAGMFERRSDTWQSTEALLPFTWGPRRTTDEDRPTLELVVSRDTHAPCPFHSELKLERPTHAIHFRHKGPQNVWAISTGASASASASASWRGGHGRSWGEFHANSPAHPTWPHRCPFWCGRKVEGSGLPGGINQPGPSIFPKGTPIGPDLCHGRAALLFYSVFVCTRRAILETTIVLMPAQLAGALWRLLGLFDWPKVRHSSADLQFGCKLRLVELQVGRMMDVAQ